MNVVVLTDPFFQPLYVPRVRALCDYLTYCGHSVEVFSEFVEPYSFQHDYELTTWRYVKGGLDWACKSVLNLLFDHKDRWLARKVISKVSKRPDVVVATTSYTFPLPAAQLVAQHFGARLIVDLRDIVEQAPNQLIAHQSLLLQPLARVYQQLNVKRRNRVLAHANALTTVSPWHVETLQKFNSHVSLIYNGFDEKEFFPAPIKSEKFTLLYAGRIYNPAVSNPDLLFQALKEIKLSNSMPELVVEWYTDPNGQQIVRNYARRYDVESLNSLHDYVDRSEVNDLYNSASVVLVLSDKTSSHGPFGILTTKFFEALGAQRPILVVQSDEQCLEQLVIQTSAGCAARNVQNILEFLHTNYDVWKHNKTTFQDSQSDIFRRSVQSQKFLELIENSVK